MIKWFTKLQCLNFFQAKYMHIDTTTIHPASIHSDLSITTSSLAFLLHATRSSSTKPERIFTNQFHLLFSEKSTWLLWSEPPDRGSYSKEEFLWPLGDIMKVIAPSSIWLPHCTLDSSQVQKKVPKHAKTHWPGRKPSFHGSSSSLW